MAENRIGIKILANRAGLSYKDTKRLLYEVWLNTPRAASAALTLTMAIGGPEMKRPRASGRRADLIIVDDIEDTTPPSPTVRAKMLDWFKMKDLVRAAGVEPARPKSPNFKSGMSTNSITPARRATPSTEDIINQSIADVVASQKCAQKCASGARRVPYGHF